MIKLGNNRLEVERAEITGVIEDKYWLSEYSDNESRKLVWCIEVETSSLEIDGMDFDPIITFELESTCFVQSIGDLTEDKLNLIDATIYVQEHEEFNILSFKLKAIDGKLQLTVLGKSNLYLSEELDGDVSIELGLQLNLDSLLIKTSEHEGLDELKGEVGKFLNLGMFNCESYSVEEFTYESGVKPANLVLTNSNTM